MYVCVCVCLRIIHLSGPHQSIILYRSVELQIRKKKVIASRDYIFIVVRDVSKCVHSGARGQEQTVWKLTIIV